MYVDVVTSQRLKSVSFFETLYNAMHQCRHELSPSPFISFKHVR